MIRGPYKNKSIEQRFWEKVDKSGDCWVWLRAKNSSGYGIFQLAYPKKSLVAHKMSWIITFGEIPKGKLILHRCDNRVCVRPDHLFIGTQMDNTKDMISKGRHRNGYTGKLIN